MSKYGCNECPNLGRYERPSELFHFCKARIINIMEVGPDPFFANYTPTHGVALVYQIIEGSIMNTPKWCPIYANEMH